jgi:hypothetical protein
VPKTFGAEFGPEYDAASPKYLGNRPTYRWVPEYFNRNAPYRNINMKFSGATETLNYYISGDVNKVEGTLKVLTRTVIHSLQILVQKYLSLLK